jgi:hypothetical protein
MFYDEFCTRNEVSSIERFQHTVLYSCCILSVVLLKDTLMKVTEGGRNMLVQNNNMMGRVCKCAFVGL